MTSAESMAREIWSSMWSVSLSDVFDAHSAGVDEFDEAIADFEGMDHAVAGDAGGGVDNGQPFADQPVEKAGLADVGATDDSNLWNTHNRWT